MLAAISLCIWRNGEWIGSSGDGHGGGGVTPSCYHIAEHTLGGHQETPHENHRSIQHQRSGYRAMIPTPPTSVTLASRSSSDPDTQECTTEQPEPELDPDQGLLEERPGPRRRAAMTVNEGNQPYT